MRLLSILVVILSTSSAFCQDTLQVSSALGGTNFVLDSITSLAAVSRVRDSLKITAWSDSLKQKINKRFSPKFVSRAADSLRKLRMPSPRIDLHTDSLMRKKDALLNEVNGKQQSLQRSVSSRYESWMIGVKNKFNLDSAGVKLPLQQDFDKLSLAPKAGLPPKTDITQKLPGTPGIPASGIPGLPAMPQLSSTDFGELGLSKDLANVGGDMAIPSSDQLKSIDAAIPEIPNPLGEVTGVKNQLKELKADPGSAAEKVAGQVTGISSATNELQQGQALVGEQAAMANQLKDPQASVPNAALNHFAGKEEVLQKAMESVAKYKDKYESLPSIADVKKSWWPVNSLKDKPFRERFRVGIGMGFRTTTDTLLLDLFPNASYRISGRFEAGLGFMYRLRINTRQIAFDQQDAVWGFNSFVVVKTFKAVFIRIEADANSYPQYQQDQIVSRDWRWSFLSGVQTNFRISTRVNGYIQMLYNFNTNLKDGFPERLSVRIGVQYRIVK